MITRTEGKRALDLPRGLDAVEFGHGDIHDHDVGLEGPGLLNGLPAMNGPSDHDQVRLRLQEGGEPVQDETVVIREKDLDAHRATSTTTRVPPPDSEEMEKVLPAL